MAYTAIPAGTSGGIGTPVTYSSVLHKLALPESVDASDVSVEAENTSNTASSTATLTAKTGASAGASRVKLTRGAVDLYMENTDGTLYLKSGAFPYFRVDGPGGVLHLGPAGSVSSNTRQVMVSHWNAAGGILAGPSLQSQGGAGERLNIIPMTSGSAGSPVDGKGMTIYSFNSSATAYRRVLDFVHRAGHPILKLCDEEGNVEIGIPGATTATDGFMAIGSCAGVPTGVPTSVTANMIAIRYNRTANTICAYNGAWRSTAALT